MKMLKTLVRYIIEDPLCPRVQKTIGNFNQNFVQNFFKH